MKIPYATLLAVAILGVLASPVSAAKKMTDQRALRAQVDHGC